MSDPVVNKSAELSAGRWYLQEQESVQKAFSTQSAGFDAYDAQNPVLVYMRTIVREHVMRYASPGSRMLELNGGTGLDALYFAAQDIQVHLTDLSEGMIREAGRKVREQQRARQVTVQQCSFHELYKVEGKDFHYVFSNFGGLNCTAGLEQVIHDLPPLLAPGAYITLVIMPKICPWELVTLLKGRFRFAFRRFGKRGARAHIEGHYFTTYYYAPSQVMRYFGRQFRKVALQGLGSVSPPPHSEKWAKRFPRLYAFLGKADKKLSRIFPFNRWCDHYILTVQYMPDEK